MTTAEGQHFKTLCRHWRQRRRLSQLDLALAADVSQRHVSWLETGRSRPSRDMIVRLSDAMDIPLRERNALLQSAGFIGSYKESDFSDPAMKPVLDALNHILKHQEPFPAVVVDRSWNVRKTNTAADSLLSLGGDPAKMLAQVGAGDELNLALLTVHPEGLRRYISNWDQAAPAFIRRLRNEALTSGDTALEARLSHYIDLAGPMNESDPDQQALMPVLPLELNINGLKLSLFSVIATFGTAQDITTDELRIETFYPNDEVTASFFRDSAR